MARPPAPPAPPAPPGPPSAEPATLRPGLTLSPRVTFPPELPITARAIDLVNAIDAHPVVIVAGETGSGKTTQLPKLCLAMGRGVAGQIGCTQPRRIAATSVAARVAEELHTELGEVVGYKVRFGDKVKPSSYVKFMTDGILLAELHGDPLLRGYDTIIIDEAHERSLNIDFLLGYLKQLLPRRPDLRVIISSATLATERFAAFFGGAPVVEVSGRTFPVDVLYRPPTEDEVDLVDAVANTVNEITELDPRGDVLVFLPGEREIRDTLGALTERALPHTTLLPLYARLAAAEQQRVFQPGTGRRVVLATNVAETSLTIPGIVYVVDTGVARVNRYSVRTGVTQLLVEPVSQASADQRKGRCGRTAHGVCFRLFEEADYASRPAYTDPEIKRVGLAGVILRMKFLGLGDVASYPFLDPPGKRAIDEGYRVLEELGAIDDGGALTPLGRQLGKLPIDPRLGRMVLAGLEHHALREVLVIAAALGLQDPRERPVAHQQRADERHRRFRDEASDFVGYLKLWDFWQEARGRSTKNQLARLCRDNFLSFPRMREWEDIHAQLTRGMRELGFAPNEQPASAEQLHRALLPGLLSKIGLWHQDSKSYLGARQTRFLVHPSSALARKPTPWVVAAELVETSQLFARTVAKIDPGWLEDAAGALCKRTLGHPHWEQRAAQVMAKEHVTLYGLQIVKDRRVAYGPHDPAACRSLFITHALVRHEYTSKGEFMAHNQAVLDEVQRIRDKGRRGDAITDEDAVWDFFDARLPPDVYSGKTFEAWRQRAEATDPTVLHLTVGDILLDEADALAPEQFPDELTVRGATLALAYRFDPGEDDDGVTAIVPLAVLPQLDAAELAWTVPGRHHELLAALLDGLPKALRKALAPVDELAWQLAVDLRPFDGPMLPAVERAIAHHRDVRVPRDAWDLRGLPPYLGLNFRVVDEHDKVLDAGRDLADLQARLGQRARALWDRAPRAGHERTGMKAWDLDELRPSVTLTVGGRTLLGYPALVDTETAVDLRLLESPVAATAATRDGLRRLFLLGMGTTAGKLEAQLPGGLALGFATGGAPSPRRQLVLRALDEAFDLTDAATFPRTRAAFTQRLAAGRGELASIMIHLSRRTAEVSAELDKVRATLKSVASRPGHPKAALDDIRDQLDHLAPPDLWLATPETRLAHIVRYLRGVGVRLQRLAHDHHKDAAKAAQVVPLWQRYRAQRAQLEARGCDPADLDDFAWLVEELRVQVFAQELGTAVPVSLRRLDELWAALAS